MTDAGYVVARIVRAAGGRVRVTYVVGGDQVKTVTFRSDVDLDGAIATVGRELAAGRVVRPSELSGGG